MADEANQALPIHHGDLCVVPQTIGTELESFSRKPNRVVLVAFIVESEAFVYPITTKRPNHHKGLEVRDPTGLRGWACVEKGLYVVAIGLLRTTGGSIVLNRPWHDRIRRHLEEREQRALDASGQGLTQRPFSSLSHLKRPDPPRVKPPPPVPREKTRDEVWKDYLEHELDEDVKRRGSDGRG